MNSIKATSYNNFILIAALIMAPFIQVFCGILCKEVLEGEEGLLVLYAMIGISIIQIPGIIFLTKRFSKTKDYFIYENEIIQNNIAICSRKDIVSITKKSLLVTEIKYLNQDEEKTLLITVSNKKLNNIKEILGIYD